ncbi:reverse transcriptase domain-containing protein [Tanacetum coccineum]
MTLSSLNTLSHLLHLSLEGQPDIELETKNHTSVSIPYIAEESSFPSKLKYRHQTVHTYSVVQVPIPEPDVAPKPNPKPSIPYPSRLNDQKLQEKANNQMLKFLQIFQRLHFDLTSADRLLHMPKFASTFKSLLNECLALADLGASINLMPFSVWKKLSLPALTPTRMTLELANRLVAYPVGVSEDVFVKVGSLSFPVTLSDSRHTMYESSGSLNHPGGHISLQ